MTGAGGHEDRPPVEGLTNADVRWDGTALGLMPILSESARSFLDEGDTAIPDLIDALGDESRFAIAHVLLTLISGVRHETAPWNGLQVDLEADAVAHIDPAQRPELQLRWRRWSEATPRPDELPY